MATVSSHSNAVNFHAPPAVHHRVAQVLLAESLAERAAGRAEERAEERAAVEVVPSLQVVAVARL